MLGDYVNPFLLGAGQIFAGLTLIHWAPDASLQAHQAPIESRRSAVADAIVEADAWRDPRWQRGGSFSSRNAKQTHENYHSESQSVTVYDPIRGIYKKIKLGFAIPIPVWPMTAIKPLKWPHKQLEETTIRIQRLVWVDGSELFKHSVNESFEVTHTEKRLTFKSILKLLKIAYLVERIKSKVLFYGPVAEWEYLKSPSMIVSVELLLPVLVCRCNDKEPEITSSTGVRW